MDADVVAELSDALRTLQGPPRPAGVPAPRPKPAATLILVRRDGARPRVLMGRRNTGHAFMPDLWVFPGGRVDRTDYAAPMGEPLRPDIAALFDAHLPPRLGKAVAMAAVRETFEETGLLLGRKAPARGAAGPWREFLAQGALPDLSALDILGRAITPPQLAKRFDAWFLMAEADRLISLERQPDCGELEEIAWLEFDEAMEMKLPTITKLMMGEARHRLSSPERPRPFTLYRGRRFRLHHL